MNIEDYLKKYVRNSQDINKQYNQHLGKVVNENSSFAPDNDLINFDIMNQSASTETLDQLLFPFVKDFNIVGMILNNPELSEDDKLQLKINFNTSVKPELEKLKGQRISVDEFRRVIQRISRSLVNKDLQDINNSIQQLNPSYTAPPTITPPVLPGVNPTEYPTPPASPTPIYSNFPASSNPVMVNQLKLEDSIKLYNLFVKPYLIDAIYTSDNSVITGETIKDFIDSLDITTTTYTDDEYTEQIVVLLNILFLLKPIKKKCDEMGFKSKLFDNYANKIRYINELKTPEKERLGKHIYVNALKTDKTNIKTFFNNLINMFLTPNILMNYLNSDSFEIVKFCKYVSPSFDESKISQYLDGSIPARFNKFTKTTTTTSSTSSTATASAIPPPTSSTSTASAIPPPTTTTPPITSSTPISTTPAPSSPTAATATPAPAVVVSSANDLDLLKSEILKDLTPTVLNDKFDFLYEKLASNFDIKLKQENATSTKKMDKYYTGVYKNASNNANVESERTIKIAKIIKLLETIMIFFDNLGLNEVRTEIEKKAAVNKTIDDPSEENIIKNCLKRKFPNVEDIYGFNRRLYELMINPTGIRDSFSRLGYDETKLTNLLMEQFDETLDIANKKTLYSSFITKFPSSTTTSSTGSASAISTTGSASAGTGLKIPKPLDHEHLFGNKNQYLLDKRKLDKNLLSIRYAKNRHLTPIKEQYISELMGGMLKQVIIQKQEPNLDHFNRLTDKEKYLFRNIANKYANIKHEKIDSDAEMEHKWKLIQGEILAGNTNSDMKRQARMYLLHMVNSGLITRQRYHQMVVDYNLF